MEKNFEFLELITDKEKLRSKLIYASLFIMAYENFLSGWKDQVFYFYADATIINGKLEYGFYDVVFADKNDINSFTYVKSYEKENEFYKKVYRLVKNQNGKGYSKELSLFKYLETRGIIDNFDYLKLEEIRNLRNKLVHELDNILYENDLGDSQELFKQLIKIRKKANENWFREVEIPIAYEKFLDKDGNFAPPEVVISSQDLIFDIIIETALNQLKK